MNTSWMGAMPGFPGTQAGMKPFADLLTVGSQALEEMTKAHVDAMTEMFDAGMAHAKAVGSTRDVASFGKAQAELLSGMGRCMFGLAQKDLDIMTRAQTNLYSVMDGAMREGAARAVKPDDTP